MSRSNEDRTQEKRQAWTIVGIMTLFLIGNIPRVVLNLHDAIFAGSDAVRFVNENNIFVNSETL